ncbi:hypothetical protein LFZ31_20170, partial [Salmonella enterica subsp. enterica serovar Newport str. S09097]
SMLPKVMDSALVWLIRIMKTASREHYPLVTIKMALKFSSTEDGIKNSAKSISLILRIRNKGQED